MASGNALNISQAGAVVFNGTSTFTGVAPGTSGNVLTSNGTTWTSVAPSGGVTGPGSSTDRAISTWNGAGGTALFNNSTAKIDSTGRQTNTAQPCFLAFLSANATNVTGDTTTWQVAFDSEAFDNGSNFTTGSSAQFTAPVTGRYMFSVSLAASLDATAGLFNYLIGVSTTRNTYFSFGQPAVASNAAIYNGSVILDMSASDTFYLTFQGAGGTKTTTVTGSANILTWMSGYLVC